MEQTNGVLSHEAEHLVVSACSDLLTGNTGELRQLWGEGDAAALCDNCWPASFWSPESCLEMLLYQIGQKLYRSRSGEYKTEYWLWRHSIYSKWVTVKNLIKYPPRDALIAAAISVHRDLAERLSLCEQSIREKLVSMRLQRPEGRITHEELAMESGLDRRTIQRLESGKIANPGRRTVNKLTQAFSKLLGRKVLPDEVFAPLSRAKCPKDAADKVGKRRLLSHHAKATGG